MSDLRLELVRECEHGRTRPHAYMGGPQGSPDYVSSCEDGFRIELKPESAIYPYGPDFLTVRQIVDSLRVELLLEDLCCVCGEKPARTLPDPIPVGHEVMYSEGMAGRGLYCEECFEAAQ